MNAQRFDTVGRMLARKRPRRRVLAALVGVTGFGMALPERALACKKVGKKCDKNKDCCDHANCKGGKNGKCRCKGGFSTCNKTCHDLNKDNENCGACGTLCIFPNACCDGECNLTCVV